MHPTNKSLKVKQTDSIEIWTDACINYAKVMIDRHPLIAGDLLSYMSIIRGAVVSWTISEDQRASSFCRTETNGNCGAF